MAGGWIMSQNSDILAALKKGEALTREDIRVSFGCTKAPARMSEIRKDLRLEGKGRSINTETLVWYTADGTRKTCEVDANRTNQPL